MITAMLAFAVPFAIPRRYYLQIGWEKARESGIPQAYSRGVCVCSVEAWTVGQVRNLSALPCKACEKVIKCVERLLIPSGLGLMRSLDDQLMLRVLGHLPASALLSISGTCKALYCFANHEELWRALVLEVTCYRSF